MKLFVILLLTLVPLYSVFSEDYPSDSGVFLHSEGIGRGSEIGRYTVFDFRVAASELRKTKSWNPVDGNIPITRDAALAAASRAMLKYGCDPKKLEQVSITLMKPNPYDDQLGRVPVGACSWFFVIRYCDPVTRDPFIEAPRVLVTMSGKAILAVGRVTKR